MPEDEINTGAEHEHEHAQTAVEPITETAVDLKDRAVDAVEEVVHSIDAVVEKWHQDFIHGSVVGRDTEAWNYFMKAKEELKKRLKAHLPAA